MKRFALTEQLTFAKGELSTSPMSCTHALGMHYDIAQATRGSSSIVPAAASRQQHCHPWQTRARRACTRRPEGFQRGHRMRHCKTPRMYSSQLSSIILLYADYSVFYEGRTAHVWTPGQSTLTVCDYHTKRLDPGTHRRTVARARVPEFHLTAEQRHVRKVSVCTFFPAGAYCANTAVKLTLPACMCRLLRGSP